MEILQAVGGGAFLIVSGVLGVRLLMLAWHNRGLPELLLGMSFLLGGTLGAMLEANASVVAQRGGDAGLMLAVGKSVGLLGMFTNCLFIWAVFRRGDAWAVGLIALIMAALGAALFGHHASGAFQTGRVAPLWFWVEFAGRITSAAWVGIEAWLYFGDMRKRVALGLAEPMVANRFLLWTIASAAGVLFLCTSVPPLYFTEGPLVAVDLIVFAIAGLSAAGAYWLAFFPPDAYRRYVERGTAPV